MESIIKICDMPYQRVDVLLAKEKVAGFCERIKSAKSAREVLAVREEYKTLSLEFESMTNICYIRFSQNTADEFFASEQDYYDENAPMLASEVTNYQRAILASPFIEEITREIGEGIIALYRCSEKCMSEEIIPEKQEEARLSTQYTKFASGLSFEFRGGKIPLTLLRGHMQDPDRETRREAFEVLGGEMQKHAEIYDEIFDKLVHVRDKMAKKLGFENFIEMGYLQMERISYNREMVENFRGSVEKYIMPIVASFKEETRKALGIEKGDFKFFDNENYEGTCPVPIVSGDEILSLGEKMFHDMSSATSVFIDKMIKADAFDLLSRENKWGGGYCTYIPKYQQPFILANFNGTSADVDVLTHESGHAFDSFETRNRDAEEGLGMETAEIHSMSMEFFCWKYADWFFGDGATEYKLCHLRDSLTFLPYGAIVDEFQHIVYQNPDLSPAERNFEYLKLEKKYRPYMNFDGMTYLEKGTRWQYQAHIFEMPFYYIDYVIAGTVALDFLVKSQKSLESAFEKYHNFILAGGSKPLPEKLEDAGVLSPFCEKEVEKLAFEVEKLIKTLR